MDRQNFLQMPSVLTGAKQPPKQEPVKILTEHCNSAIAPVSERGKYLLGGPLLRPVASIPGLELPHATERRIM